MTEWLVKLDSFTAFRSYLLEHFSLRLSPLLIAVTRNTKNFLTQH